MQQSCETYAPGTPGHTEEKSFKGLSKNKDNKTYSSLPVRGLFMFCRAREHKTTHFKDYCVYSVFPSPDLQLGDREHQKHKQRRLI